MSTPAILDLIQRSIDPLKREWKSKICVELGGVLEALVQSPEAHPNLEAFWATGLVMFMRDGKGTFLTARDPSFGYVKIAHDGSHHGFHVLMSARYIDRHIKEAFTNYRPPAGHQVLTSYFTFHVDLYASALGARPVAVLVNEATSEWTIEPFEPYDLAMLQIVQSTVNMLRDGELDLGDIPVVRPGNPRANVY